MEGKSVTSRRHRFQRLKSKDWPEAKSSPQVLKASNHFPSNNLTRVGLEGEAGVSEGAPVEAAAFPAQDQRLGESLLRDPEPSSERIS